MNSTAGPIAPEPTDRCGDSGDFEFTSGVDRSLWSAVEALFFFNPRQSVWIESIRRNVEEFGVPRILERGERICVGIPERDAQCLFACDRARQPAEPVGVVLYLRTAPHLLRILHLAVGPAYADDGPLSAHGLTLRLVDEVRALGSRIAGVQRVELPYRTGRLLSVIDRSGAPRRG